MNNMETAIENPVSAPQSLFKKRTTKPTTRKRLATPPPANDSDSSGYTSTDGESGQRIKRRKKAAIVTASSSNRTDNHSSTTDLAATTFSADRSTNIQETNDATKQSNWFDEKDSAQLLGTTRSRPPTTTNALSSTNDTGSDGTYKGTSAYQSYISKNPNAPTKQVGPVKAPTNIRTITVTDFAPDVCKDYKQTGFCGFGDSCKFLHAREDYKQGWELDRDWEIGGNKNKKKAKQDMDEEEEEGALLENIPFACIICKKPYTNPIVTKCGHYFCEGCALGRYRKNPNCAACGAGTNGVFNGAKQLKKLLDKKRERAKKRKEKARDDGEEVWDGEREDEDEEEEIWVAGGGLEDEASGIYTHSKTNTAPAYPIPQAFKSRSSSCLGIMTIIVVSRSPSLLFKILFHALNKFRFLLISSKYPFTL